MKARSQSATIISKLTLLAFFLATTFATFPANAFPNKFNVQAILTDGGGNPMPPENQRADMRFWIEDGGGNV